MLILLSTSKMFLRPCMAAANCSTHVQQRCNTLQQELTTCILHAGNLGVWLGTFLYNMSCITPAIPATLSAPPPPRTLAAVLRWAVAVPNVVAGCLFVSGSYCTWAAAGQTGSLLQLVQRRAPSGGFWACLLYFMVRALQGPSMQSCTQRLSAALGSDCLCLSGWLALCFQEPLTCAVDCRKGCLLQAVQLRPFVCGLAFCSS